METVNLRAGCGGESGESSEEADAPGGPSIQPVGSQAPPSTAGLANISPHFVSVKIKDVEAQVHETVTN